MMGRLVLMCLLAATMVFAQRSKGGGGSKGPDIPQGGFATSRLDRVATMLALDKDQKKELKTTFDEAQKEAQPLHDQISKARLAVAEAVAGGKTPDEIGKACTDEAQLEAQMTEIELKAFTKFAVSLTPEQRPKASALFSMMRGLFAGKNWNEAQ